MLPDTGYWFARLKVLLRLVVSQGVFCLRLILALARRLLRLHDPKRIKPGYHTAYGSSCAIQQHCDLSGSSAPPLDSVQPTTTATAVHGPAPPNSTLTVHQYPPMPAPSIPQTLQVDLARSASPAISAKAKLLVQPFAPEDVQRYDKHFRINKKADTLRIQSYRLDYSRPPVSGWQRCMHPEGAVYFRWIDGERQTITDSNIDDQRIRDRATYYATRIWSNAAKEGCAPGEGKVLVLAVSLGEVETCGYYFVSHGDRLIFWMQDFIPDSIFSGVKGVEAIDHIKHAVQSQYWAHCDLYPDDVPIGEGVVDELRSMLVFATSEAILTDNSLVPYSVTELQQLLDLVTNIGDSKSLNGRDVHLMCFVARLMRIFARLRFVNFHGQPGARLNADQSIYGKDEHEKHMLLGPGFKMLNMFLFGGPCNHIEHLHRIWVDRTINVLRWRTFIVTLSNEWNGFTIYSTVMLAVDVSFLAIPEMNGSSATQTIAQVAIYLSTLSAVGSLLASVLLTNSSRGQESQPADDVATYMLKMADNSLGLNSLALMFSLPFALIIWGMIFFIIAFSSVVFGMGDLAPRVVVVPFWLIVAVLASLPAWYQGGGMFFWLRRKKTRGSKIESQKIGGDPV